MGVVFVAWAVVVVERLQLVQQQQVPGSIPVEEEHTSWWPRRRLVLAALQRVHRL